MWVGGRGYIESRLVRNDMRVCLSLSLTQQMVSPLSPSSLSATRGAARAALLCRHKLFPRSRLSGRIKGREIRMTVGKYFRITRLVD